jgi:hypothetical protein
MARRLVDHLTKHGLQAEEFAGLCLDAARRDGWQPNGQGGEVRYLGTATNSMGHPAPRGR